MLNLRWEDSHQHARDKTPISIEKTLAMSHLAVGYSLLQRARCFIMRRTTCDIPHGFSFTLREIASPLSSSKTPPSRVGAVRMP